MGSAGAGPQPPASEYAASRGNVLGRMTALTLLTPVRRQWLWFLRLGFRLAPYSPLRDHIIQFNFIKYVRWVLVDGLDGEGSENWIIPVAVLVMAVLGAVVGWLLPGVAGPDATQQRGALIGAVVGVVMLVLGIVVFFLLLSGFDGA